MTQLLKYCCNSALKLLPVQCTIGKISHKLLHGLSGQNILLRDVTHLTRDIEYHQQIIIIRKLAKVTQAVRDFISFGVEEGHGWLFHFEVVFSNRLDDFLSTSNRRFLTIWKKKE